MPGPAPTRVNRRGFRVKRSLGPTFTFRPMDDDFRPALEEAALARGMAPGEWLRHVLDRKDVREILLSFPVEEK